MDYLETDLFDYVGSRVGSPINYKEITRLSIEMLESLRMFHQTQKLHRDLKPKNFRIHNGKVYLIDYGNSFEYILSDKGNIHRPHSGA